MLKLQLEQNMVVFLPCNHLLSCFFSHPTSLLHLLLQWLGLLTSKTWLHDVMDNVWAEHEHKRETWICKLHQLQKKGIHKIWKKMGGSWLFCGKESWLHEETQLEASFMHVSSIGHLQLRGHAPIKAHYRKWHKLWVGGGWTSESLSHIRGIIHAFMGTHI